jgi:hypothetical protein
MCINSSRRVFSTAAAAPLLLLLLQVQEVCSFIEKAHGLNSGWLMAAPQFKVCGLAAAAAQDELQPHHHHYHHQQ